MRDDEYKIEERTITIMDRKLIRKRLICDECRKEITGCYWNVTVHDGFNNEDYDMCSKECINKKVSMFIDKSASDKEYDAILIKRESWLASEFID